MIRLLQLVDLSAGFQTERASAALTQELGPEFAVTRTTFGTGGTLASGLSATGWLRNHRSQFDLVHAWGTRALTAAALATRGRILFSPGDSPGRSTVRWVKAVMNYRTVDVICPTTTLRRAFIENGIPLERCHLIRPGVDFAAIRRHRQPSLRAMLGFTDADRVLLFCGESTREAGHRQGVWAASILHVFESKYKVLLWGRGPEAAPVMRFATRMGSPNLVVSAEQKLGRPVAFEELLPLAEIALVTANRPVPTLPISICMAGALPIVAVVSRTASELLEDRHTALFAPQNSPKALAQRVMDMEADANLRWALADMARTEAYEYFSLTRFHEQHRTAYRQAAAGQAVDTPEPAPGAGLRFHGRG